MTARLLSDGSDGPTTPLLTRMKSFAAVSEFEERLIASLSSSIYPFELGGYLQNEDDSSLKPWIIASGWACRLRTLPDGRRQIFSFLLPGDTLGMGDDHSPLMTTSVLALTRLDLLDGSQLKDAIQDASDCPELRKACDIDLAMQEKWLLDHTVRLGRLTAYERIAHLLLELDYRLELAGLSDHGTFPLPITQAQFGDALGLSIVHVNRTLQELRRDRMIILKPGMATILDRERLQLISDFRPPQFTKQSGPDEDFVVPPPGRIAANAPST